MSPKTALLIAISFLFSMSSCTSRVNVDTSKIKAYSQLLNEIPSLLLYSDTTRTEAYFDSLFSSPQNRNKLGLYFKYLSKRDIFRLSMQKEHLQKSLIYADSAYELQKEFVPYLPLEDFSCVTVKGIIEIKLNKYAEGLKNLYEGKKIASTYLNTCEITRFNEEIAYLFFSQRRYLEAKKYYEQILQDREDCSSTDQVNFYNKARTLNNIAFCNELLGNLDSAINKYEEALSFVEESKTNTTIRLTTKLQWEAVIKGNLGYLYFKTGSNNLAESYLRENITINKVNRLDIKDGLLTEIKLAELLISKGELEEANQLIDGLKDQPLITSSLNYQARLKKVIWLYYDYQKNLPKAYTAYQDWQNTVNQYSHDDVQWRNIDILSDLEVRENRQVLSELKQKNFIQTMFLLLLALILSLSAVITYLIFKNNRNIKKYVVELESRNQELNRSYTDLENTLEENARILGILAHDLRSPLSGISGYATIFEEEENEETRLQFVQTIKAISNDAMQLIEDLLTFDGLSETDHTLSVIPIDEIITYCISLNKFKASEKHQQIRYQAENFSIRVNRDRFWRVINNLLNNAIKFSPQFASITIHAEQTNSFVRISVIDRGIGIPEQMKEGLFTSEKKHRRAGTDGEVSNGMGLSICKKIVEAHSGIIRVESVENQGSTFIVELPLNRT
ncbi:MAG: sensor histidine kinase [Bacteroidetes bacterium]|nr:sensor histidine kinase [Bacteroidota bacterium]